VIGAAAHIAPQCGLAGNVSIDEYVFVGAGCTVIPGVHIGEGTIIGAGSAVIKDVPPAVTAVGVPARIIRVHNDRAPT
jgi:UDP-perosamine 4-acetyltransferase